MDYNQNDPLGRQEQRIYVPATPVASSPQPSAKTNSFAIAALICGICSLVLCCVGILSIPLGAMGILFSVFSLQKGKNLDPLSIIGLILSIIGLILGLLMSVYFVTVYLASPDYHDNDRNYYDDYYDDDYDNDYYDDDYDHHYNDHYYDHYNDDFFDDYDDFDDYYDDFYRDYYDDYYRNFFDDDDNYFDGFYDYGFEFL